MLGQNFPGIFGIMGTCMEDDYSQYLNNLQAQAVVRNYLNLSSRGETIKKSENDKKEENKNDESILLLTIED